MNKPAFLIILFALSTATLFAQIPPNWDTNQPRDTSTIKYVIGLSQPFSTEQEAVKDAMEDAIQKFASSISTRFEGQSDITVQSQSLLSGIEDAYTVRMETSTFSTNIPLSGVTETARKIEYSNGQYIARVLATISVEDYNTARQYIENEESSFLAYRFFEQRNTGLPRLDARSKPQGYPDYYSWLRNNCVILSVAVENPIQYLEQLETFTKKLYRNSVVFPEKINNRSVRIIYDSARYYGGILSALESSNIFSVSRENFQLSLTPVRTTALTDFRNFVANMKDSSRIFVIGNELINTENSIHINTGNILVNQFKTLASRNYSLTSVTFNVPSSLINTQNFNPDAIVDHIKRNLTTFPARYAAICTVETILKPGITAYNIKPNVVAYSTFILYDTVTGETHYSEKVDTAGFLCTPSNMQDQTVINEARRAIQFLFDPENRPGLIGIMETIFTQL